MLEDKLSYFQGGKGVNEPAPKKKKYKSDPTDFVMSRFENPLFRNYDLYNVPGKHSPGTGVYHEKNKSVKDFLKKKKKKLRRNKIKLRAHFFNKIIKQAIDFKNDHIHYLPILDNNSGVYSNSVGIGGHLDEYLPLYDFENKSPDKLNFGRDYDKEIHNYKRNLMKKIIEKILNPKEPELIGISNGFEPESELDADFTTNEINPYYGTTDLGILIYDNMWI